MAVPSKESFENFLTFCEWNFFPDDHHERSRVVRFINQSKDWRTDLLKLLTECSEYRCSRIEEIKNHEVYQWVEQQVSYQKAKKSMWSRTRFYQASEQEYIKHVFNYIDKRKTSREEKDRYYSSLAEDMNYFFNPVGGSQVGTLLMMAKPFYSYFYTSRALDIYRAKVEFDKKVKKLYEGLKGVLTISAYEEFLERKNGRFSPYILSNLSSRFIVNDNLDIEFNSPVTRNDETIKERMLVYDLDSSFRVHFRNSKANAIFHLMMIEGVKHNLEKRTIERLLEKWRKERLRKFLARKKEREERDRQADN